MQGLIPPAVASLIGVKGLATSVGFIVLMTAPAQLVGASLSGSILTATGGDYRLLTLYSGGVMILSALLLLPAKFASGRSNL